MNQVVRVMALLVAIGCTFSASAQELPATIPPKPLDQAPALLRAAKQKQDWLARVASLHVRFDDGTEMAYDAKRLYQSFAAAIGGQSLWYWDGKVAVRHAREGVYEITDSPESLKQSFLTWTTFGRTGQTYWWTVGRRTQDDFLGDASLYQYVGRQNYHEIECHVVKTERSNAMVYIGVASGLLHGTGTNVYLNYKEVAPGCWYPMTHLAQGRTRRVEHIAVDAPLPETLFAKAIPEGARVVEAVGGTSLEYVKKADRPAEETMEMRADMARRQLFAPPAHVTGTPVALSSPIEPLPLNPLAMNPAAEFPQGAEWINGGPVRLADLRGKVVLIVFWANWQEFTGGGWGREQNVPDVKVLEPVRDEVRVIGVHVPTKNPAKVALAARELKFEFPICIDLPVKEDGWGTMAEKYRLDESPAVYVIDPSGMVAAYGTWDVAVRRAGEVLGKPLNPKPANPAP